MCILAYNSDKSKELIELAVTKCLLFPSVYFCEKGYSTPEFTNIKIRMQLESSSIPFYQ